MILERVVIEDFKSIKKLNLTLHDLTCIVGKNESGKSAILEAISFLNHSKYKLKIEHTNKSSKRYDKDQYPLIIGYFLLNEEDNKEIFEIFPIQFDEKQKAIPKTPINYKWLRLSIKGSKIEDTSLELVAGNNKSYDFAANYAVQQIVDIKEKLQKLIPFIELFTTDNLTLSPITFEELNTKTTSNVSFRRMFAIGGVEKISSLNISQIEKLDDKLFTIGEKLTALLQRNYKQDISLRVEVKYVGNKFLVKFLDSSKRSYKLSERSFGFQYFFAFLINKTYLNTVSTQNNLFLLDEPGTSLHPEGARDLIQIFEQIVKDEQIVYTTHNPFLAYRKKPDNLILAIKDEKKGTEILTKTYTNKYQVLRKELGLMLNDSFLVNDINLVVEGNADKYILHYIIHEDEGLNDLTWVHIYSADSATEIIPSVRYLNSLDLKGVVLLDSDKAALKEISKPKFKTHITTKNNWDHLTLDEIKKDGAERTIEDMLLPQKYVEAYNSYYEEQVDTIDWLKPFQPIVVTKYSIPILDIINPHFREFSPNGINKIAILRKFTQMFPYDSNVGFYKDLKNILMQINQRVLKLK
ncbi:hypothetical protein CSC80_10635 [Maribacter sp. 6B07]|uniref:ATP-dependent nuclease n=1 Tax=Maribacter sp. 6B07 TaxID=2045442 RepID=UPI000C08759B|nr:AAA family ATPase [Maribacter sp. 6B07]PHN93377.1 hypothetical protein CSC80_10635 [Maribacter sp. 6B07]